IQRIEEEGGEVSMFRLVTELPEMFGVSEASVRAYISSNAFEVENGYVRQADTSKFSPKDPRSIRGAFESNGRWSQMIKLNDNHFNGYSLGVTFDLAFANGIRPNDELAVPILGGDDQGTIIWRPTSLNRLVDVGRISKSLRTLGFRPGDYTLIEITRESIYLGSPSQEQMLSETYPDDDGDDLIFDGSFNENLMSESSVLERKSR
ncbi:hypothetical protein N9047_01510, partial [bacterium]|nr:hypothetical protein [bacterium]